MSSMGRKEREAAELQEKRRRGIMKAATELFNEKSIQEVSLAEIARRAEVSKATIYTYFESKEDLIFWIMADLPQWTTNLFENDDTAEPLNEFEKIQKLFETSLDQYDEGIIYKHLFMSFDQQYTDSYPVELESCRRWLDLIHRAMEEIMNTLRSGIANGNLRKDLQVDRTAALLANTMRYFGGTASVRRTLLTENQGVDPKEEYKELISILLNYIKVS